MSEFKDVEKMKQEPAIQLTKKEFFTGIFLAALITKSDSHDVPMEGLCDEAENWGDMIFEVLK